MPHKKFTAPFVYWEKVPQHDKIKSVLLPKVKEHAQEHGLRNDGSSLTTFFTPLESNASILNEELLHSIIWNQFNKLQEELQLYPIITESFITHLWYNVYDPGDYTSAHFHTNADFCGMYLLDCPDKNNTLFHPQTPSSVYPFESGVYKTDHITEGEVIFWPSHLMHSATPSKTERTVVVFNITSGYDPSAK